MTGVLFAQRNSVTIAFIFFVFVFTGRFRHDIISFYELAAFVNSSDATLGEEIIVFHSE